jgi:predicted MFS family arabinose efflux permease
MRLALFLTGSGAFLNLYAPQPLLPLFRQLFHASELQTSLTVSVSVLAVALMAPLTGLLADLLGRKGVILVAMLGLGLTTVMAATAGSLSQLLVWRFLQGTFIPGIIAVAMAYISEEAPAEAVGSIMATYVTGGVIGGFSGRFVTGLVTPAWGWHAGFLVLGTATLLSALVISACLPRSRRFVRQRGPGASFQALGQHLRNPHLLATYAVGFNVLLSIVAMFTYVNFYLADPPFALGPAALSSIFAVYLIGATVTPTAGRLIDAFGQRRSLVGAVWLSGVGVLLTLIGHVAIVIAGLALLATGVFACQAAAASHVGKAAGHAYSSAAGLYVSFYYFGGAVGSFVPGLFWARLGWPGCVAFVLTMQALTAGIAYFGWRD